MKGPQAALISIAEFFNGIYFTNYPVFFLPVLGLPPASEIPQYSPLPGACLEGQIHCEWDTPPPAGSFILVFQTWEPRAVFSYFLCEAVSLSVLAEV